MKTLKRIETQKLLASAIVSSQKWEGTLGKKKKGKAEKVFEALANGRIELGNPQAYICRLDAADFERNGTTLSPEIAKSMQAKDGYHFYVLRVPVLLFPARGAQYRLLESQLTFAPIQGNRAPAIQSIFPEPFWKPVLNFGGKLDLALDGNLNWGVGISANKTQLAKLDNQMAGRAATMNQLVSFIKVIPFEHTLGRMEIESQFSSKRAMWRLDSSQVIRSQKHTQLIVLLKAPKDAKQITLEGVAQAEVSFDWLTAQVEHILKRLPKAIQNIIKNRKGLPLQHFQTWTINLPL